MPRLSRLQWFVLVALLVVGLYALVGFTIMPGWIRSVIQKTCAERLTKPATVGRVRVNPFTLTVRVDDFSVRDSTAVPLLGFQQLELGLDALAPLRGVIGLRLVRLAHPSARIEVLKDGSLNLATLMRSEPVSAASTSGKPPTFAISRLRIEGGSVGYADYTRPTPLIETVVPIDLDLTGFSTRRGNRNGYALDAQTAEGESLAWRGTFTMEPLASEGTLRLGGFRSSTLQRFMAGAVPFDLQRGTFDFGARYRLDGAAQPAEVALTDMRIDVHDLAISDHADTTTLIRFPELVVRDGAASLSRREIAIALVGAHGGSVRLPMGADGHMVYERWAQPAVPDTGAPWVTRIAMLAMAGTTLEFEDQRLARPARLSFAACSLEVHDFTTAPGARLPLTASAALEGGGSARLAGTMIPSVPSAELAVRVRGFDVPTLQPYASVASRIALIKGRVDADGRLRYGFPGGPLLSYTGRVSSRDFRSEDARLHQELLSWKSLDLVGFRYDMLPSRIELRRVTAVEPYVRVVISPERTLNVADIALPPDSLPPAFRSTSPETVFTRIDSVAIRDGSAYFADLSLKPSFATGIVKLNGSMRDLSSADAAHAIIELDGQVDADAPVSVRGTLNPLGAGHNTDVTVSFKHIELTTFTPYAGKFMGYPIERGKLSLDLRYLITGRELQGENKIRMEQLTLGPKTDSPDATHLPVKFAIALLKDRNGNIDLDLPVKGNLDDPKFSIGRIVLKVLMSLITKAVTSPFALFGAIFGKGDQFEAVTFDPGSAVILTGEISKIDALGKGLADRPGLRLDIEQNYDATRDSLALADRRFRERLLAAGEAGVDTTAAEVAEVPAAAYTELLTKVYRHAYGAPPPVRHEHPAGKLTKAERDSIDRASDAARLRGMEQRVRADIHIEAADLQLLGRRRAEAIKSELVGRGSVGADRIFIVSRAQAVEVGVPADSSEANEASHGASSDSSAGQPQTTAPAATRGVRVRLVLSG